MRKYWRISGLFSVVFLVLFGACSEKTSPENAMSSVTLRWQRYPAGTPEEENRWNRAVIEEFKKRTGVSVEIAGASWDDGLNRIMSAVASGEGPDVIQLAEQWTGQAYSTGAFLPLDDKIDEFGGYEAYYSGALKYGQFGGSTYGLPWGGDCRAFYFRGSILEQAGVIPPDNTWTWDDMRNILLALKGNGFEYPFSMEGSGTQFDVFYFWYYTMLARGGQFLTNNEKTAAINTPAGRKALQDIIDLVLVDKTLSPSMAENDPTMNSAAFINGTALLLPAATGTAAEAEAAGITDVMCQTPPRGPNGEFGAFLAISVQSVFDASKHKDTALEFLRLLMEPEWQISYNKTAGWLPARIEAWDDPYFSQGWRANIRYGMENGTAFMPGNEHAASVCRIMASHLGELYSAVALGTYRSGDVEKTLAAAERAVQAELDR